MFLCAIYMLGILKATRKNEAQFRGIQVVRTCTSSIHMLQLYVQMHFIPLSTLFFMDTFHLLILTCPIFSWAILGYEGHIILNVQL